MAKPKYAQKRDKGHGEIVAYLIANGCEVVDCSMQGSVPDLLCRWKQYGTCWIEVKNEKDALFTFKQLEWMANTRWPVGIVTNKEEALAMAKDYAGAIWQEQKDRLAIFCQSADKGKLYTPKQVEAVLGAIR